MRNPRLKQLKNRLTPQALERRTHNMASKNTWRSEMEVNSAKQFGLINGLGQWLHKKDQTQTRYNRLLVVTVVYTVALTGYLLWVR